MRSKVRGFHGILMVYRNLLVATRIALPLLLLAR